MEDDFTMEPEEAPKGYLSAESKRKFTITAGILGALFFIAQFLTPFLVMLIIMPSIFWGGGSFMKVAHPQKGAYWNGAVWYTETPVSPESSSENRPLLKKIERSDETEPTDVAELFTGEPWLLAGDDRLWIISSSATEYYNGAEIVRLSDHNTMGNISPPFLYRKRPAVIEERPGELFLRVLDSTGDWQMAAKLDMAALEDSRCIWCNIQVLSRGEKLYAFLKHGDTLFFREGLPLEGKKDSETWHPLAEAGGSWYASFLGNDPVVFTRRLAEGGQKLVGLRRTGDRWESFFTFAKGLPSQMGVFNIPDTEELLILMQSFPGSLRLLFANHNGVVREIKYGSGFPFPFKFMPLMFTPHAAMFLMPIILAVILSALMRRHRVCNHEAEDRAMPMASLTRRAFAQIFDIVFVAGPFFGAGLFFFVSGFDMEDVFASPDSPLFIMLGFFVGGGVWMILCLLVFSYLEGKWGGTPGKWITGIRVLDTDLQPCGFGRALLRNLLKFIDGFFNFMVGIMVVALSENWQRVGDMAARTVVIHTRGAVSQISQTQTGQDT